MGCCTSRTKKRVVHYNVALKTPKVKGESCVYRNPNNSYKELHVNLPNISNLQELFDNVFSRFKKEECLGKREYSMTPEEMKQADKQKSQTEEAKDLKTSKDLGFPPLNNYFTFMNTETIEKKVKQMGSGITNLELAPELQEFEDFKVKFVGIYGRNSVEWFITDMACAYYGFSVVPIYDTLGEEATKTMFEQTNLTTLFLTCTHLNGIIKSFEQGRTGKLRNIVIMDSIELEYFAEKYSPIQTKIKELQASNRLSVYHFKDILDSGEKNLVKAKKLSPETIFTLSYTSGTTGVPKGAIVTHKNVIANCTSSSNQIGKIMLKDQKNYVLSFLPLAHVMERSSYPQMQNCGYAIGVYSGDILQVKKDLMLLKPSIFGCVPRFFNRVHDAIKYQFENTKGIEGTIARWGVEKKLKNLREKGEVTHWLYDRLLFNKIKTGVLGGNVLLIGTGSAPMSKDVMEFLRICLCVPISDGYGQTECCGAEFSLDIADMESVGYVGGIWDHLEFKIIDVPEMNYFSNNVLENGRPCPQGEILVRGAGVIPGYYKARDQYDKTVDKDGWLHSGDIGELGPNNSLKIIDRAKNIFKLSQGEYIAPDRLAEIFKSARSVFDIFVYGDSLKSCIVAIVHPNPEVIKNMAAKNGIEYDNELKKSYDFEKLCVDDKIKELIIQDLKQVGVINSLKGFEQVKGIYLSPKNFGELDLLTDAFKVKRKETENYFKSKIDVLYKKLD